jgi:hypothetical protein
MKWQFWKKSISFTPQWLPDFSLPRRTVDEICETRARKEFYAGVYSSPDRYHIPEVCPYCGGRVIIRHQLVNQEDSVPVGICANCDIAWVTSEVPIWRAD